MVVRTGPRDTDTTEVEVRGAAHIGVVLSVVLVSVLPVGAEVLVYVETPQGRTVADLGLAEGVHVYHWGEGWAIAETEPGLASDLESAGWRVRILDREPHEQGVYYLIWAPPGRGFEEVAQCGRLLLEIASSSAHLGRTALVRIFDEEFGRDCLSGFERMRLAREPLPAPARSSWAVAHSRPGYSPSSDSLAEWLAQQVTPDSLLSSLRRLEAFRTRYSFTDSAVAASHYLVDAFHSFGIDSVYLQHFHDAYSDNVVATLPGSTYPDEQFIVCGHYDSTSEDPFVLAPGADDNASGTALVLETARVLSQAEFGATILFVCFAGEEQGLVGSEYYASEAFLRGDQISGVLNFDMVGYQDDERFDCYLFSDEPSRDLADFVAETALSFSSVEPLDLDRNHSGSDHARFQNLGYQAIFMIEAWETLWYPYYHTTNDTVGNLSISFLTETTRMSVAAAALLAGPPGEPPSPPAGQGYSVRVVPNPFRATDSWTGWNGRIEFRDLPAHATVRIYTIGGDRVATIRYTGEGGGSIEWDPVAADVASGIYLFSVEAPAQTVVGTFAIIR